MESFNLLPSTLSVTELIFLIGLSCLTSFMTVSIGIGGGTVLLAIMAQILPVKAIIPVHGVVQLGSNLGRTMVFRQHIQQPHVRWFLIGSALGAIVGSKLVIALPTGYLKLILGSFILFSVWGPKPPSMSQAPSPKTLSISGGLSTLLTMFVGATGPFVMASLRPFCFKATELVATNAACLSIQHSFKVIAFGLLGFAFSEYLATIFLMITSGFIGTLAGRRLLLKVDEDNFRRVLNWVLTLLALRLVYSGVNFILLK